MKIDFGIKKDGIKKPLRLWILFDDHDVGQNLRRKNMNINKNLHYPENWTPIESVVVKIRTRKNTLPAHALTVHESQGQTLPQVVAHLNTPMRRDSCTKPDARYPNWLDGLGKARPLWIIIFYFLWLFIVWSSLIYLENLSLV